MAEARRYEEGYEEGEQKKLLVQRNFGAAASDYVTSKVHAQGPDLGWIVDAAALTGTERVLDVATGTGNTGLALAPYAAEVVALDTTRPMLEAAEQVAEARGITNMRFVEGDAQKIPFADMSFDVVTCRQAPHHFPAVQQAVREWARVLKPDGKLLLIDSVSPEDDEVDALLHKIEILRDPSHVRSHRISEWLAYLQDAGLNTQVSRPWGITLDVADWTQRMRTPAEDVKTIVQLLQNAPLQIQNELGVGANNEGKFSFVLPSVFIVSVKRS